MLGEFVGVLLVLALAGLVAAGLLALHRLLAPRRLVEAPAPEQSAQRPRLPVNLLRVALLFLLLELAVGFLAPWAALLRELGGSGLVVLALFLVPVATGLLYQRSRGVSPW